MTNPYYGGNNKSRDAGSTLSGLGALLRGLNSIRDPRAEERKRLQEQILANPQILEQLRQQVKDDPEAINTLLGAKPLFGRSNYGSLETTLRSESTDPEVLAKRQEAKNRLAASTRLGGLITRGQQEEDINKDLYSDDSGIPKAQLRGNELTVPLLTMNARERAEFNESKTKEGIRTGDERARVQAQLEQARSGTRLNEAQLEGANLNIADAKDKKIQEENNRIRAASAIARVGPKNLYKALKNGEINSEELSAINALPEYTKTLDTAIDNHYKDEQLRISQGHLDQARQQTVDAKYITFASHLVERAERAGVELLPQEALAYAKMSRKELEASNNPTAGVVKTIIADIQRREAEGKEKGERGQRISLLKDATSKMLAATSTVEGLQKDPGYDATVEDVAVYNGAAPLAFIGTGFTPQFKLQETSRKGRWFGLPDAVKHRVVMDPESIPEEYRDLFKSQGFNVGKPDTKKVIPPPKDEFEKTADAYHAQGVDSATVIADIKSQKLPPASEKRLIDSYIARNPGTDSSIVTPSVTKDTTTTPPIQPDTTFQSVQGGTSGVYQQPPTPRDTTRGSRVTQNTSDINRQDSTQSISAPIEVPVKLSRNVLNYIESQNNVLRAADSALTAKKAVNALSKAGVPMEQIVDTIPTKYRSEILSDTTIGRSTYENRGSSRDSSNTYPRTPTQPQARSMSTPSFQQSPTFSKSRIPIEAVVTRAESPYVQMLSGAKTAKEAVTAAQALAKMGVSFEEILAKVPDKLKPYVRRQLGSE